MLRPLTLHMLSSPETVVYKEDGSWGHNKKDFVSFPQYVTAWAKRKFGSTEAGLVLASLESALKYLGPNSEARFSPGVEDGARLVRLEIVSSHGTHYRGNVYYDYEDPEWFGISVRLACSMVTDPNRGVRPQYECP